MEIRPFEDRDVDGAAALLAVGLQDPSAHPAMLRNAVEGGATGASAIEDGRVIGFLLATAGEGPRGRHVWSDLGWSAYADDPEVMRLLYSELSKDWIGDGRGHHYVVAPRAPA